MDGHKFGRFKALVTAMQDRLEAIREAVLGRFLDQLDQQQQALAEIHQEAQEAFDLKMHLYLWQEYHVRKNFMRARDAMEERTFNYLALGFQEFSFQVRVLTTCVTLSPGTSTLAVSASRVCKFVGRN